MTYRDIIQEFNKGCEFGSFAHIDAMAEEIARLRFENKDLKFVVVKYQWDQANPEQDDHSRAMIKSLDAQLVQLKAEQEMWGNEFAAITYMKEQISEWKEYAEILRENFADCLKWLDQFGFTDEDIRDCLNLYKKALKLKKPGEK